MPSSRQKSRELRAAKYENILATHPEINLIKGQARFKNANTLIVDREHGEFTEITADRFLIATGSSPGIPPIPGLAGTPYWTSTEALIAEQLPEYLIVIGSGIVALELVQAFLRLGTKVTLLARHTLMYREDPAIGSVLQTVMEDEGMTILTNTQQEAVSYKNSLFGSGKFTLKTRSGQILSGDQLLIATGRPPNTESLDMEKVGVKVNKDRTISIDDAGGDVYRTANGHCWLE